MGLYFYELFTVRLFDQPSRPGAEANSQMAPGILTAQAEYAMRSLD